MSIYRPPTYVFSTPQLTGEVGPYVHLSLSNPTGSGKVIIVGSVFISQQTAGAVSMVAPMRGFLATEISGGTLVPATDIAKALSVHDDPVGEIREDDPAATLGAAWFNSPALQATGAATGPSIHQIEASIGGGTPLTLLPGEGTVLHTLAGNVNQRWNLSIAWAEFGA